MMIWQKLFFLLFAKLLNEMSEEKGREKGKIEKSLSDFLTKISFSMLMTLR